MRHGSNNRRQRGRGNPGRRGGNNRMQVFDSNGPDVRIRGTAHQVLEKYMALAKDATSSGDLSLAENYLQHAEHYQRIINEFVQENPQAPREEKKPQANTKPKEGELGLPSSILGNKADNQVEATKETRTVETAA